MRILSFALRLIAAGILLQTLYFKFSGAPESKFIFSALGAEPWGRWLTGGMELIAAGLLLCPATISWGALLSLGLMSGALLSHALFLGISVQGDRGLLFGLALAVFFSSLALLIFHREQIQRFYQRCRKRA